MSRIGQCPACRCIYELEDDSIGQVFQCACEATLFAADIAGFSEIPVFCSKCDGHYVVDSEGAGEDVECECGETLTVPNMVLRQPVSGRDDASKSLQSQSSSSAKSAPKLEAGQRLIDCPDCGNQYVITSADLGVEAECSCGCVFAAKVDQSKKIVAVKVTAPKPVSSTASNKSAKQSKRSTRDEDTSEEDDKGSAARREKKRSPLVIAGVVFAGLLLVFAMVMFGMRQTGLLTKAKPAPKPRPPLSAPISAVAPVAENRMAENPVAENSAVTPADTDPGEIEVVQRASAAGKIGTEPVAMSPEPQSPEPQSPEPQSPKRQTNDQPSKIAGSFAPPPLKELPVAKPRRALVPVIAAKTQGMTFDRVYKQAFDSFNKTKELQAEPEKVKAFQEQLGRTIGLLQDALRLNREGKEDANLHQIRYLLTYCYYHAGRLPEASVMAEAVVRWGKKSDPATKEAAMIGLAATQEANQTHWGVPSEVGELDRMRIIIELVAKKWPDDPNLDLMRMNLAQSFDRFNQPRKAAGVYRQIDESSSHYVASRLATGGTLWSEYRRLVAATDQPAADQLKVQNAIRRTAKESLEGAIKSVVESDSAPTKSLLAAKLTLARIALSETRLDEAEKWLTANPMSLTETISVDGSGDTIQFSAAFVQMVYETLYSIRSQQQNVSGATEVLAELAAKLGDDADMGKMYLSVATDYIDQLEQTDQITQDQFSNLVKLIQPLQADGKTLTSSNILWLGESWSRLADRAANDNLSRQCNEKAAAAYELAMSRADFPSSSKLAGLVRRSQLLRAAGQLDQAVESLTGVLTDTPNAIGLQIEAVEAIQQSAIESDQPLKLAAAIDGPKDSPIWGWEKLVTTIYSASGDEAKNAERLAKSQYQLVFCKWEVAKATADPSQKAAQMAELAKLISRLEATMKRDIQPWYGEFTRLAEKVKPQTAN